MNRRSTDKCKHAVIHCLVKVEKNLLLIKAMSASPSIDRMCIDSITQLERVGQAMYPDLAEMKLKYQDPME